MGALATAVPVEVYLNTSYSPDCDYVDGEVLERNVGEMPHASVQKYFIRYFGAREEELKVRVYPEQRVQTSERRCRVADVCVLHEDAPWEGIVRTAPLLCIEVLSPKDRMSRVQQKLDDYIGMGVQAVWLVDPRKRLAWSGERTSTLQPADTELTLNGTAVRVRVAAIFRELDRFEKK